MTANPWPQHKVPLPTLWAANPACAHLRAAEVRLAQVHLGVRPSDVEGPIVGLIVGEAPSARTHKALPMYPYPPRSSGGRALSFSGMTPGQFLGRMRRIDLEDNPDAWSASSARAAAERVRALLFADWLWRRSSTNDDVQVSPLRVLLCGSRVAAAFGIKKPFESVTQQVGNLVMGHVEATFKTIPHPSARNPVYLDENLRIAAGIALRWCGGYF